MFMVLTISNDEIPKVGRSTFDTVEEAQERFDDEIASGKYTSVRLLDVLRSWSNGQHIDPATNSPINPA